MNLATPQPVWDDCTGSLYYSDIATSGNQTSLYRYDLNEDKLYGAFVEGNTTTFSCFIPIGKCNDNQFILCHGHDVITIQWDGKTPSAKVIDIVYSVSVDDPQSIVNVVPDNVRGFVLGSTFNRQYCVAPKNDIFYKYSNATGVQTIFNGIQTQGGVIYDGRANRLYNIDACPREVAAFNVSHDGNISKSVSHFDHIN